MRAKELAVRLLRALRPNWGRVAAFLRILLSPWACVLWIVLAIGDEGVANFGEWVTSRDALPFIDHLLSWPVVALLIILVLGRETIRGFVDTIEEVSVGGVRRGSAGAPGGPAPQQPKRQKKQRGKDGDGNGPDSLADGSER